MIENFSASLQQSAVRSATTFDALAQELRASRVPSVVILGRSIPGLLIGAGLSALGHRVLIVTGGALPERKLVNGCTLRYAPLTCIADLLQTSVATLADRLGGKTATFHGFAVGREARGAIHRGDQVMAATTLEPSGVSTRHGHIIATLCALLPDFGNLRLIAGQVPADAELSANALPLIIDGQRVQLPLFSNGSVILNATPNMYLLRPKAPRRAMLDYVYAVQVPLRGSAPWGADRCFGLVREGEHIAHQLFFAPFADPASPDANTYIFNGTAFSAATLARLGREKISAEIDNGLKLTERFGFTSIDPEQTRSEALISYWHERGAALQKRLGDDLPMIDINTAFSSGAPGVALDGMASQAAAAHAFVRAFAEPAPDLVTRAKAALVAADKKAAGVRRLNRTNSWLYYRAPAVVRATLFATTTQASLNVLNRFANRNGAASESDQAKTGLFYALAPNLWTLRVLQPFGLSTFSSRMTVVRLKDGALLLHSPVFLQPQHIEALAALGPVRFIVAPTLFHHRALAEARTRFSDARVFVPPGFAEKLPAQAKGTTELDENAPIAPEDLTQIFMRGHQINETIFLHRESKTLLVTDLAYNIGGETTGSESLWFRFFGVTGGGPVPSYNRKLVTDVAAFETAWKKVLALDFDRVSVAHGRIIVEEAKTCLAKQWKLSALLTANRPR